MTEIKIKYNSRKEAFMVGTAGLAAVMNLNPGDPGHGEVLAEIDVSDDSQIINIIKELLKILHESHPRLAKNAVYNYLVETGQVKDGVAHITTKDDPK